MCPTAKNSDGIVSICTENHGSVGSVQLCSVVSMVKCEHITDQNYFINRQRPRPAQSEQTIERKRRTKIAQTNDKTEDDN